MPYTIIKVEPTPNPYARKLIVDPSPGSIRSYFNADDADTDPIGRAIFAIEGITNVLIHTGFISVCIAPGANWKPILQTLKITLAEIEI